MTEKATHVCSFAAGGAVCREAADWVIAVGEDTHLSCDAHRNDVLFRFEPKDVSGIWPIAEVDADLD